MLCRMSIVMGVYSVEAGAHYMKEERIENYGPETWSGLGAYKVPIG